MQKKYGRQEDPVRSFWQWFIANEPAIYALEENQESVLDAIEENLKRINEDLCFAIGAVEPGGKREFVISAGGIPTSFPAVEALARQAPQIARWRWQKFRPRLKAMCDVEFDGHRVALGQVRYIMLPEGKKVSIALFIEGYSEQLHELFGGAAFLMLDNALGEYVVATQVGAIDLFAPTAESNANSQPLAQLQADFDNHTRKLIR